MKKLLAGCCIVLCGSAQAQNEMPVKFGTVSAADFAVTAPGLDSGADAVVVADFGNASFEMSDGIYNPTSWGLQRGWNLVFRHSKRIHILNRKGFAAATVYIPLLAALGTNTMDQVQSLKATTYNLEDGKVVATVLDSKSIFRDKVSDGLSLEKFTFPGIKEGAILEYTYTVRSPFFFTVQPWAFQEAYPCLWSEYQLEMPSYFNYVTFSQGSLPFAVQTEATKVKDLSSSSVALTTTVVTHRWVMSHIPALREEPYTTSLNNYIAKIEFQLASIQIPGYTTGYAAESWGSLSEMLLKNQNFGEDLDRNNSWLKDDMKTITAGAGNDLEKAQKIYAYVRDHFTCSSLNGVMLSSPSLKTVYTSRSGGHADLNLLLTAMLIYAKIVADPVILSTRSNGFTNKIYPQLGRFNYVISKVTIGSSIYYLDASDPNVRFGQLPVQCYNGSGRVVNKDFPQLAMLSADSVTEKTMTTVIIANGEKGGLEGGVQIFPGMAEAAEIRKTIKGEGDKEYLKKLRASYPAEAAVSDLEIDSLQLPDEPLGIAYNWQLPLDSTVDRLYFTPTLTDRYRDNPFKAAERSYPVEMPYAMDQNYILTLDIPNGYTVEELPKSEKLLLNTDQGFYEYILSTDEQSIHFRSRIRLMKANFDPEDYATLRDFFAVIVKKQGESIVFKKKK